MNAGELADRFGLAIGAALEARSELAATAMGSIAAAAAVDRFTVTEEPEIRTARRDAERADEAAKRAEEAAKRADEAARRADEAASRRGLFTWRGRADEATELAAASVKRADEAAKQSDEAAANSRRLAAAADAAAARARESKRAAGAALDALVAKLDGLESTAAELGGLVAELRADAAGKIEAAEDLRRQAMSAYRVAAEAWRALAANSDPGP